MSKVGRGPDLVIQAAGITISGTTGIIDQRILTGLLPPRRLRISTRKVKSPISRYHDRQDDGRPDTSRTVTGLDVTILEPGPSLPTTSHDDRHIPPEDRRRQRVLDLLRTAPDRYAPAGPRPPSRRRHPGHHAPTTRPMGPPRAHPQSRTRHLHQPSQTDP